MQVHHVPNAELETLLDPSAAPWKNVKPERVALTGTPAGMQPTAAIRVAWTGKPIGAVTEVAVSAIHNGNVLAFRLEWEDPNEDTSLDDNTSFPDAAAIALPAHEDAPLVLMGAPGAPVNAWYWRADEPEGARQVSAEGLGSSRTLDKRLVTARGAWKEGRWRVVIARAMRVEGDPGAASLEPGTETGFGVAIWEGSHGERAGIKAFSGDWLPLDIEAATGTGRKA
jgi:DMSO reductase family type II enzyme heme b subunit